MQILPQCSMLYLHNYASTIRTYLEISLLSHIVNEKQGFVMQNLQQYPFASGFIKFKVVEGNTPVKVNDFLIYTPSHKTLRFPMNEEERTICQHKLEQKKQVMILKAHELQSNLRIVTNVCVVSTTSEPSESSSSSSAVAATTTGGSSDRIVSFTVKRAVAVSQDEMAEDNDGEEESFQVADVHFYSNFKHLVKMDNTIVKSITNTGRVAFAAFTKEDKSLLKLLTHP